MKNIIFLCILFFSIFHLAGDVPDPYKRLKDLSAEHNIYERLDQILPRISGESQALNREGFEYYKEKNWPKALSSFKAAFLADEDNGFAWFNYACTLSLQAEEFGEVVSNETLKEIQNALLKAANINEHWVYMLFLDSDLDYVREYPFEDHTFLLAPGGDCAPSLYLGFSYAGEIYEFREWDSYSDMGSGTNYYEDESGNDFNESHPGNSEEIYDDNEAPEDVEADNSYAPADLPQYEEGDTFGYYAVIGSQAFTFTFIDGFNRNFNLLPQEI